jgi:rod shape-determining protein MreC
MGRNLSGSPIFSRGVYPALLFAALMLFFVPEAHVEGLRGHLYSALSPVLKACRVQRAQVEPASIPVQLAPTPAPETSPAPSGPPAERLAAQLDLLREENARLRSLINKLGGNETFPGVKYAIPRGTSADVIARKLLWQEPLLGLDKGEADGVQLHAGVLHRGAVLGRIVAVGRNASSMALLTHHGMSIAARLSECRMEGLLRGGTDEHGEQLCRLSLIGRECAAKAGEQVVTSGFDGAFPPGLWLGEVTAIKKSGDVQWEVTVRPACNENIVETVHVLTGKMPEVPWPAMRKK